jgi:uncharacterized protein (TIGR02246 family)
MKAMIYTLLVGAALTGCNKQEESANVQSLNQQFIGAWNSKDAGKVTGMLADDVDFVQGEVHYKGKSEVTEKWVNATMPTTKSLKTSVISSVNDAQTAYEAGTFSVDVLPQAVGEKAGYGEGNYMLLWKKATDGTWKLSYAQLEDLPVQVKQ